MTHTLHRQGNLKEDFVVMAHPASHINTIGSGVKIKKFIELGKDFGPVNCGVPRAGNLTANLDQIVEKAVDGCVGHIVFDSSDKVVQFLKTLKKEKIGISVVVTGIFEDVNQCCEEAALKPHTVNMSLGVFGDLKKLPRDDYLPITTMCGHGMVTEKMINETLKRLKKEKCSLHEAAEELAKPCVCGIFNINRAAAILDVLRQAD